MVNVWDELDFWMMSGVILMPAIFALGLIFFPSRRTEAIRWWTLIGTLVTFVGVCLLFVDFLRLTDEQITNPDRTAQLLSSRAELQLANLARHEAMSSRDLVARKAWIGHFYIDYSLGIDGLNMALLLLGSSLFVLAFIASWKMEKGVRGFCMLFLLIETGLIGLLLSLDFFLFYVFLEVTLLPLYFLIPYWGEWNGDHTRATPLKFVLLSVIGSVLILVAVIALYFVDLRAYYGELHEKARLAREAGKDRFSAEVIRQDAFRGLAGDRLDRGKFTGAVNTFDLIVLSQAAQASARLEANIVQLEEALQERSEDQNLRAQLEQAELEKIHWQAMSPQFQLFCFLLLFIGFAIKLPIIPFHTWLPDVLQHGPTPVSMILTGIVLKVGAYGLLRVALPICPWAAHQLAWLIGLMGVIGIVYGALVASAQVDLRRIFAYSSISQMGFVLLGIAAWTTPEGTQYWSWGVKGAVFQMLAHGFALAGLLFIVELIRERTGQSNVTGLAGLAKATPVLTGLALVLFCSALGLPLLAGFVGEFCAVLAAWHFHPSAWPAAGQVFTMIAAGSFILIAGYIFWTIYRIFLTPQAYQTPLDDLDGREGLVLAALAIIVVLLGIWPMLLFDWLDPTLTGLVQALAQATGW